MTPQIHRHGAYWRLHIQDGDKFHLSWHNSEQEAQDHAETVLKDPTGYFLDPNQRSDHPFAL